MQVVQVFEVMSLTECLYKFYISAGFAETKCKVVEDRLRGRSALRGSVLHQRADLHPASGSFSLADPRMTRELQLRYLGSKLSRVRVRGTSRTRRRGADRRGAGGSGGGTARREEESKARREQAGCKDGLPELVLTLQSVDPVGSKGNKRALIGVPDSGNRV